MRTRERYMQVKLAQRALKAAIVDMHQSLPRPYAEPTEDCELMNQRSRELAELLRRTNND